MTWLDASPITILIDSFSCRVILLIDCIDGWVLHSCLFAISCFDRQKKIKREKEALPRFGIKNNLIFLIEKNKDLMYAWNIK